MTNALRLSGVTLPGTGYPKKKNFVVPDFPVGTGLIGLYVIGGTESFSLINHANASLPMLKVGAPTVGDLGAATSQANCFDTQIAGSESLTVIVVAKPVLAATSATGYLPISNYMLVGGVSTGDSLAFSNVSGTNKALAYIGKSGGVNGVDVSIAAADPAEWNGFAARFRSNGAAKLWWSSDGIISASSESATAVRSVQSRTLRVGGHYEDTLFQGTGEVQMAAVFAAELSDSDVAANLEYLSTVYGPSIGVSTL